MKKSYLILLNNNKLYFKSYIDLILLKILKMYRSQKKFYISSSKVYNKKFCIETKHSRSVNRIWALSRMKLKEKCSQQKITGLKRITW